MGDAARLPPGFSTAVSTTSWRQQRRRRPRLLGLRRSPREKPKNIDDDDGRRPSLFPYLDINDDAPRAKQAQLRSPRNDDESRRCRQWMRGNMAAFRCSRLVSQTARVHPTDKLSNPRDMDNDSQRTRHRGHPHLPMPPKPRDPLKIVEDVLCTNRRLRLTHRHSTTTTVQSSGEQVVVHDLRASESTNRHAWRRRRRQQRRRREEEGGGAREDCRCIVGVSLAYSPRSCPRILAHRPPASTTAIAQPTESPGRIRWTAARISRDEIRARNSTSPKRRRRMRRVSGGHGRCPQTDDETCGASTTASD